MSGKDPREPRVGGARLGHVIGGKEAPADVAPVAAATPGPLPGGRASVPPSIVAVSRQSASRRSHAAEAVLDKLNRGVVIFDSSARVHFVNDAALSLVHPVSSIAIPDGHLVFTEPAARATFAAFLQRCVECADGGAGHPSVVMRVSAGNGHPPYRVLLSPLRMPAARPGCLECRFVLMVYDPHAGRHVSKRILRELYGLSDAEADLAMLLFGGESLETASQRLHVSVNTAKTHLHHVFVKCDVHSQGELLQLLALGPRTL